jgi:hypothetical protein
MTDTTTGLADKAQQAQQVASDVKSSAVEGAGTVAEAAKQETKAVVADARDHAQHIAGEARDQLKAHAAEQTDRVAQTLQDIRSQLDRMLRGEGAPDGLVADVTRQVSARVDRAAGRLQEGGLDGVVTDVKRFARNRPGMFLLGALGAGVVTGRLLRTVDKGAIKDAATSQGSNGDAAAPQAPELTSPATALPTTTGMTDGGAGLAETQAIPPARF